MQGDAAGRFPGGPQNEKNGWKSLADCFEDFIRGLVNEEVFEPEDEVEDPFS